MGSTIYTAEHQQLVALLRALRRQAGMTQTDLAARLGRTQSFVTTYETNRRRIDFVELLAVLRVFGTSLSEFAAMYEDRSERGLG